MTAPKWRRIVYPDGGSVAIRDPEADDPDLWYFTALDLARYIRSAQPNRNLGYADRLLGAGEWEIAIQHMLEIIQDDPAPCSLVIQALRDRIDQLKPQTRLWGYD